MTVSVETPTHVLLGSIDPNPYQPREGEDAEHIKALAISIAEQGLLQIPQGRLVDGNGLVVESKGYNTDYDLALGYRVQLAFGHSRLAAFRFLTDTGNAGFESMPVVLRELSDAQMFDLAISENLQRRDLTPIEEAIAMRRARDEFGMNSAQIGSLFGLNESTVRNKMRLVELTEPVQKLLKTGELPESTARRLLPLAWLGAERVEKLAAALVANPDKTTSQIEYLIEKEVSSGTQQLYRGWQESEGIVQDHLWPLTWRPGFDQPFPDFKKEFLPMYQGPTIFDIPAGDGLGPGHLSLESMFRKICAQWSDAFLEAQIQQMGAEPVMDAIRFWVNPPACQDCPFYVKVNKGGYCGKKACYQRKKAAWLTSEVQRMSDQFGLAVYEPTVDGLLYEPHPTVWNKEKFEEWQARVKAKDADLRVIATSSADYDAKKITGADWVMIVSVSPESLDRMTLVKAEQVRQHDELKDSRVRWEEERKRTELDREVAHKSRRMLMALAGAFADVWFGKWSAGAWAVYQRGIGRGTADYKKISRQEIAGDVLDSLCGFDVKRGGPVKTLEWLRGVAREMGAVLPPDADELALQFEQSAEEGINA